MKLNLGCGYEIYEGYINIDIVKYPGVVNLDLNKFPFPYKDNSIDEILCYDILEHLEQPVKVLMELHRIIKYGSSIRIRLPHFSSSFANMPVHKSLWSAYYFGLWETDMKRGNLESGDLFDIKELKITFHKGFLFWNNIIEFLVNINRTTQLAYETSFFGIFPAKEILIELKKK